MKAANGVIKVALLLLCCVASTTAKRTSSKLRGVRYLDEETEEPAQKNNNNKNNKNKDDDDDEPEVPTPFPSSEPTFEPTFTPTGTPVGPPSVEPSTSPPTEEPTNPPTDMPSDFPSPIPSFEPSLTPTGIPTLSPSEFPTTSTSPSAIPTTSPAPSEEPSDIPSTSPTMSSQPTTSDMPSMVPTTTSEPSLSPSASSMPTAPATLVPETPAPVEIVETAMPSSAAVIETSAVPVLETTPPASVPVPVEVPTEDTTPAPVTPAPVEEPPTEGTFQVVPLSNFTISLFLIPPAEGEEADRSVSLSALTVSLQDYLFGKLRDVYGDDLRGVDLRVASNTQADVSFDGNTFFASGTAPSREELHGHQRAALEELEGVNDALEPNGVVVNEINIDGGSTSRGVDTDDDSSSRRPWIIGLSVVGGSLVLMICTSLFASKRTQTIRNSPYPTRQMAGGIIPELSDDEPDLIVGKSKSVPVSQTRAVGGYGVADDPPLITLTESKSSLPFDEDNDQAAKAVASGKTAAAAAVTAAATAASGTEFVVDDFVEDLDEAPAAGGMDEAAATAGDIHGAMVPPDADAITASSSMLVGQTAMDESMVSEVSEDAAKTLDSMEVASVNDLVLGHLNETGDFGGTSGTSQTPEGRPSGFKPAVPKGPVVKAKVEEYEAKSPLSTDKSNIGLGSMEPEGLEHMPDFEESAVADVSAVIDEQSVD